VTAAAALSPEARAGFARRAERLHLADDSVGALRLLADGVRRHPGDVTARLVLARVCRDTGRAAEAAKWLEEALRLDPSCPAALQGLGDLAAAKDTSAASSPAREPARHVDEDSGAAPHGMPASRNAGETQPAARMPASEPTAPASLREFVIPEPVPVPRVSRKESTPVPAFAFPVRDEEEEPEIEENSAPHVATVTLAEIYLQQGLKEQAAQIYRQLLERQPGDDSVRRRLRDIEAELKEIEET
jgi:tetratricopeptide (TPR) repeat protein